MTSVDPAQVLDQVVELLVDLMQPSSQFFHGILQVALGLLRWHGFLRHSTSEAAVLKTLALNPIGISLPGSHAVVDALALIDLHDAERVRSDVDLVENPDTANANAEKPRPRDSLQLLRMGDHCQAFDAPENSVAHLSLCPFEKSTCLFGVEN